MTDTRKRARRNLFLICWIAYFSTYLCRLNLSAVMPEWQRLGVFTNSQTANIGSCFFIAYGVSQLVSGVLGDRLNPRYLVFGGLLVSGATNIAIGIYTDYTFLTVCWCLNGIAQAFIWCPILRLAANHYGEKERTKFSVNMSSTVPLGTLSAYGLSMLILTFLPWNAVFGIAGGLVVIAACVWLVVTKRAERVLQASDAQQLNSVKPISERVGMGKLFGLFAVSGVLLMFVPIAVHGALKDSVTQWVPVMITQNYHVGTQFSLLLTMLLPLVNVTGAYFAAFINRFIKNETATAAVFFAVAAAALTVLYFFGGRSVYLTVVLLAIITNCMFAVNVLFITLVPLRFGKYGRASTASGILNAVAYVGCGISNFATGLLLDADGWSGTISVWMGMAVCAFAVSIVTALVWKKYVRKDDCGSNY